MSRWGQVPEWLKEPGRILHDDDGVLVLNKPSGVPTAGDELMQKGSAQAGLMAHARRMIWAVHQLDRPTTGVNLFVRRKALVGQWSEALRVGTKTYLAWCHGYVSAHEVDIREPLGWCQSLGRHGVRADGKSAHTHVRRLGHSRHGSLLEVTITTGRTHQIRAHLSHIGHPLVGDHRYGSTAEEGAPLALHAWQLRCGELGHFEAPCPEPWATWLTHFEGLDPQWVSGVLGPVGP